MTSKLQQPREESTDESGDSLKGFEEFVRDVAPDLLGYFIRRVHPADAAADCLGEVLLVLWRRRLAMPISLNERRAWAFGIAHRVLANHFRSNARRTALTEKLRGELEARSVSHGAPVPTDLIDALGSLRPADRELILLVAWNGFAVAEAAVILGIRADAARARYSRARKKLRAALTA